MKIGKKLLIVEICCVFFFIFKKTCFGTNEQIKIIEGPPLIKQFAKRRAVA